MRTQRTEYISLRPFKTQEGRGLETLGSLSAQGQQVRGEVVLAKR